MIQFGFVVFDFDLNMFNDTSLALSPDFVREVDLAEGVLFLSGGGGELTQTVEFVQLTRVARVVSHAPTLLLTAISVGDSRWWRWRGVPDVIFLDEGTGFRLSPRSDRARTWLGMACAGEGQGQRRAAGYVIAAGAGGAGLCHRLILRLPGVMAERAAPPRPLAAPVRVGGLM